ncbi:hypothetical protein VTI74DRAFT_7168 [Chaetomium olivicolor]
MGKGRNYLFESVHWCLRSKLSWNRRSSPLGVRNPAQQEQPTHSSCSVTIPVQLFIHQPLRISAPSVPRLGLIYLAWVSLPPSSPRAFPSFRRAIALASPGLGNATPCKRCARAIKSFGVSELPRLADTYLGSYLPAYQVANSPCYSQQLIRLSRLRPSPTPLHQNRSPYPPARR